LPVDVCPVDCIHPTNNEAEAFPQVHQLYIDPEESLIAGPAKLFVPLKLSFENDALEADMEQIEEQLKRERER
jgi:formate hydrogenlyase subunit 6/NADH:ubiquinone oxidoreductase subunit I